MYVGGRAGVHVTQGLAIAQDLFGPECKAGQPYAITGAVSYIAAPFLFEDGLVPHNVHPLVRSSVTLLLELLSSLWAKGRLHINGNDERGKRGES